MSESQKHIEQESDKSLAKELQKQEVAPPLSADTPPEPPSGTEPPPDHPPPPDSGLIPPDPAVPPDGPKAKKGAKKEVVPEKKVYTLADARFTKEGICLSKVVRSKEGVILAVIEP